MLKRIRTFIGVALLSVLSLLVAGAAHAQTRTFYIDYTSGSNSNSGSSKSTPWKTHPYMQTGSGCTGGVTGWGGWSHAAGDQYIFKGGVTWPVACFDMSIPAGGNSGVSDYYGVDKTWFTGGSFTRPLFDMGQNVPTGRHVIFAASGFPGYTTFDNLEIANQGLTLGNLNMDDAYNFDTGSMDSASIPGVLIENNFIHDWISNTNIGAFTSSQPIPYSSGSIEDGHDRITVDRTTIEDSGGFVFAGAGGTTKITGGFGGACVNCKVFSNGSIHDTFAGCFTVASCHDNDFFNISQKIADYAGDPNGHGGCGACRPHSQVIEDDIPNGSDAGGWMTIYNNRIHDNPGVGVTIFVPYNMAIFNNVMWNNSNGNILLGQVSGDSGAVQGFVYNNTIDCSNATPCIKTTTGGTYAGTLFMKNNHWITNSSPTCFGVSGCGSLTPSASNNFTMSTTEASTHGYTSSRHYIPSSSDSNIVGAGANLSSSATGSMAALAQDIEGSPAYGSTYVTRTVPWTIGATAYPPSSGSSVPIDSPSPTSLTFATQTTGTSSSQQTITLTNTGTGADAISGISVTGANATQFTQTNTCPSSLAPGNNCTISVTFSPSVSGSLSANVSITDTANPSGASIVSLSGTGQSPGLWTNVTTSTAPGKFTSSATCSATLGSTPAAGSTTTFEVIATNGTAPGLPTVADGASNAFTGTTKSPVGTTRQASIFYLLNTPGGASPTITATFGGTIAQLGCWAQNTQVASGYTPTFDADASGTGSSGTSVNAPTFTPGTAQEHVVAVTIPTTAAVSVVNSPFTGTDNIFEPTTGAPFGAADGWVENQTSAVNPSMTLSASDSWAAIIAGIKAVASGSTPTISSLSITSGNEGASVTITGTNFGSSQGASTAQINSTSMTCGTWSATSLVCTIPTPATTGGISVTTSNGTSNSVTFTITPHIASLSVTSGDVGTGTVLTGTGFGATQGTSTLALNGTAAKATAWSDSSITTTVPSAATTGSVIVTQGGNASNAITFTVTPNISSLNPTSGVVGAGVIISGTTFGASQGSSTVKFNGTTATCTTWSPTSLSCPVPSAATTGNVVVNVSGNNSNGVSFTVNAPVSTPVIAAVTPNIGLAGTTVTITGSNFGSSQGASTVSFNGVNAAVSSWSATQIVCTSPATATTGNILVTVSAVASNPVPYGVYQFPTITIR